MQSKQQKQDELIPYQTKVSKLAGTTYREVRKKALEVYNEIKRKTKRKPYIRSVYFLKQKIFFDYYWTHLWQSGGYKERIRRLRYFGVAIEVIRHSRNNPVSIENPHKQSEILHRFAGCTREGELFFIQIKEHKPSGKKYFMSCFPVK